MHRDGFGCLHTEDISGREIEGLPFLQKTPAVAYIPQDANVISGELQRKAESEILQIFDICKKKYYFFRLEGKI